MTNQIEKLPEITAALMETAMVQGDIAKLSPNDRLVWLNKICVSLGLNPLTRPFEYISFKGKTMLYARKDATDQLRKLHDISIERTESEMVNDVYIVTAYAKTPSGRVDSDQGAVSIKGLTGDDLANAMMKAHTKAKRRVTLSICGLGMLDETELATMPSVKVLPIRDEVKEKFLIDAIAHASDKEELKVAFTEAYNYGKEIQDKSFIEAITTLKDAIKQKTEDGIISISTNRGVNP